MRPHPRLRTQSYVSSKRVHYTTSLEIPSSVRMSGRRPQRNNEAVGVSSDGCRRLGVISDEGGYGAVVGPLRFLAEVAGGELSGTLVVDQALAAGALATAGLVRAVADLQVFYIDFGMSTGMKYAEKYAKEHNINLEYRKIY